MTETTARLEEDSMPQPPPSNPAVSIPVAPDSTHDSDPFHTAEAQNPTSLDGVIMSTEDERDEEVETTSMATQPPDIPQRGSTIPRANCTHTAMEILHTDGPCDFCGRSSRLGWLYLCQQDVNRRSNTREQLGQIKDLVLTNDMTVEEELEAVGMSESVIKQFKRGVYTLEQLDKLMEQKLNLQKVIVAQLELEYEPWNTHTTSPSQSDRRRRMSTEPYIHPNVTLRTAARKESLSIVQKTGNARRKSPSMSRCSTKACQICRPYFKDRTYMSLGSIFTDDIRLLKTDRLIPIRDAAIVRNLGLRPPMMMHPAFRPGPPSIEDSSSSGSSSSISSSNSFLSEDDTRRSGVLLPPLPPSQTSYSSPPIDANAGQAAHRASTPLVDALRAHLIGTGRFVDIRPKQEDGQSSTSMKPDLDRKHSEDSDQFDLRSQKSILRSSGSNDLLAATPAAMLPGLVGPSGQRGSAASSVASDEVPVEGGVALTEEALENEVPDIITEEAADAPLSDVVA